MTKTFREFLKDDYNIQCVDDEFWNSTIQCNICSDKISDYAEEYAKQKLEELKSKLPTEEELFNNVIESSLCHSSFGNRDECLDEVKELAKSIRQLIEEKLE